ncbi:MAG: 2-oxoacid:acceptor oxidoreductase family protein [Dissulfurispiraceae bacterium]|jgi:2-oxoglutarate ferredoxin oxidoreductase subunit gamma
MEYSIIIAGSGGQGTLFLGRLMAYAAMLDGKEVTWMPSYGAEMRGGTANCTVIISDEMIGSPVIRNPHILIIMNDASYSRFAEKLLPGGMLLYDSSLISRPDHRGDITALGVPASDISTTVNSTKLANMVMMGAFLSSTGILSPKSVLSALNDITPQDKKKTMHLNKQLIEKGFDLIGNKKSDHS